MEREWESIVTTCMVGGDSSDGRDEEERGKARKGGAERGHSAREEMARERGGAGLKRKRGDGG